MPHAGYFSMEVSSLTQQICSFVRIARVRITLLPDSTNNRVASIRNGLESGARFLPKLATGLTALPAYST